MQSIICETKVNKNKKTHTETPIQNNKHAQYKLLLIRARSQRHTDDCRVPNDQRKIYFIIIFHLNKIYYLNKICV